MEKGEENKKDKERIIANQFACFVKFSACFENSNNNKKHIAAAVMIVSIKSFKFFFFSMYFYDLRVYKVYKIR